MDEHEKGEKQNEQKNDSGDADIMELEVFRQHWRSLNAALSEIRELRGADAPEIDPVEFVKHEVGSLKNQFAELKEMLVAIQQNQQQNPRTADGEQSPLSPLQPDLPFRRNLFRHPNPAPSRFD